MATIEPPLKCTVCDSCICFCNDSPENICKNAEIEEIEHKITMIKQREQYLQYLRQELEKFVIN